MSFLRNRKSIALRRGGGGRRKEAPCVVPRLLSSGFGSLFSCECIGGEIRLLSARCGGGKGDRPRPALLPLTQPHPHPTPHPPLPTPPTDPHNGRTQAFADTIFPPNAALCAFTSAAGAAAKLNAGNSGGGAQSLGVLDLSGVFLLQAFGLVLALFTKLACVYFFCVFGPQLSPFSLFLVPRCVLCCSRVCQVSD